MVGSFNIRGASFSQSERTWVRHHSDPSDDAPTAGGVKGTVSPSDLHAFRPTKASTPASEGCAASAETETGRSAAGGGRAEESREGGDGDGDEGEELDTDSYAVYLHRRREARVVGLREAVGVEVLPLSYELATFSRIVNLRVSPSATATATATATASATAASESQEAGRRVVGAVRWAPLGLSAMFNSSAAVTAQVTADGACAPRRRRPLGEEETETERVEALLQENSGVGVSLTVKGSGTFLAVASREPASVRLYGAGGGGGGGVGFDGGDGDGVVVLRASFSALSCDESSTTAEGGAGVGEGGTRMGLVEVDIPSPWDGRERRLVFRWV